MRTIMDSRLGTTDSDDWKDLPRMDYRLDLRPQRENILRSRHQEQRISQERVPASDAEFPKLFHYMNYSDKYFTDSHPPPPSR